MAVLPSGEQYELRAGSERAVVTEVGAGLRLYDGVLDGYDELELCPSGRGQVLAPWPNRINDGEYEFDGEQHRLPLTEPENGNAIHGLVRWANWQPSERTGDRVVLEYLLHAHPGYPFTLRMSVEYRLTGKGLEVRTSAENVGDRPCPFGAGHHPYVAAPTGRVDDMSLQGKPIGTTVYDDTLAIEPPWRIEVGDVVVWADEAWNYVQLYTGDDRPDVARRAIAVEPMTCPPNAFRNGDDVVRLEPGERFEGRWGIERA